MLVRTNELRAALLQAVSHDLRTPLTAIRAAATTLLSDDVEWDHATSHQMLQMIDDEAGRLNRIVANLLDMSRLQVGVVEVRRTPTDIGAIVGSAIIGLHLPIDRVSIDIDETLPAVLADGPLLERAVANIIENAARAAPEGTTVEVTATAVGDEIHLYVVDHGVGIPAELHDKVFQPFQRFGDQTNGTGVGLGLAVARGFIEAFDGRITIRETPGGGCTMIVALASETR